MKLRWYFTVETLIKLWHYNFSPSYERWWCDCADHVHLCTYLKYFFLPSFKLLDVPNWYTGVPKCKLNNYRLISMNDQSFCGTEAQLNQKIYLTKAIHKVLVGKFDQCLHKMLTDRITGASLGKKHQMKIICSLHWICQNINHPLP